MAVAAGFVVGIGPGGVTADISRITVLSGGHRVLGHLAELRDDRLGLLRRAAQEIDRIAVLRVLHRRVVLINAPSLIHEVLVEKAKSFDKPLSTRVSLMPLVGAGLVSSKGDARWRRHRRLLAPLFTQAELARFGEVMVDSAAQVAARWQDGAEVPVMHEAVRIAMAAIARALFSADDLDLADAMSEPLTRTLGWTGYYATSLPLMAQLVLGRLLAGLSRRLGDRGAAAIERLAARLERPLLLPGARTAALRADVARIEARLLPLLAARRASGETAKDLLDLLIRACDDQGHLGDQDLRDEIMTFFGAGNETTASAIAWTLDLLDRNPEARLELEREVDALAGRRPAVSDLPRLPLTARAFKEALRLYPPIYMFARESVEATTVGGYHLPAGTSIYIAPYMLHRRPDLYPEPERFDLGRFSPEAEASRPRLSWLPFGTGPRVCIGAAFAMLEGVLVLATLIERFRFERVSAGPVVPLPFVTLRPAGDMPMRVRRRA
ncbi:cytochrome P450 [Nannocystis exedens]|uniref:cytochrome P450 n=1 Tax=Nannocystis exedens TaxID=54 RepID=UPI001474BDE8|nr:cytochrome P450 [Nannocystis exedens]